MFQDENNIYEIAYMMCNESIKKMLGDDLNIVIDKAVDDTVMMFSPKVKDGDALKKYWLNHKFCGISDSSRSSVGSYRIASERNIRHQDIRIPVCEES